MAEHLLTKFKILTAFSIAMKLTEKEISDFYSKNKKKGKSNAEIEEMLKNDIYAKIHKLINEKQIPGMVTTEKSSKPSKLKIPIKTLQEINKYIMIVQSNLIKKNCDKISLCYFINTLVNVLGLTEADFQNYQKNFNGEDSPEHE